ncbi:MAG: TIGR04211 family SH3 domain-containing protein [Gammaproteobacteria bacterium]|nr:TIGR04211 family SH3 domain-containing protein [Gammaproteobacteria bacterium]
MKRIFWTLLILWLGLAQVEAAFITDRIRVGLYPEPDNKGQPIKVLLSGEEIKRLEEKGGFVQVELNDGSKGWIGRQYLSDEEPAVRSLVESRRELAALQQTLEQTRAELASLQQQVNGAEDDNVLKDALAAANRKVKELEDKIKQRAAAGTGDTPSCEQQLDAMEARQLQCQVRLAKHTAEVKETVAAENDRLREIMQQAVNLLNLPPNGEVPLMIPASAITSSTRVITQPAPAPVAASPSSANGEVTEPSLPVWIYLVLVLTLITGVIAGFALFDFRSRYRFNNSL